MTNPTPIRPLLTVPEVARMLGVREDTIYELARTGRIPIVRIGRQVRVDAVRLGEMLRAGGIPLEAR
jgi:excisionase family DNA binding protein